MSPPSWSVVAVLVALGASAAGVACGSGSASALPDAGASSEGGTIRRDAGSTVLEAGTTPPEGGSATGGRQMVTLASGLMAFDLRVSADGVYAAVVDDPESDEMAIVRIPLSGGAPVTLVSGQYEVEGIAVTSAGVYWADFASPTVEADASSFAEGFVAGVPIGGGAPTTLATGQGQPYAIAADATSLYWLNLGGGCPQPASCPGGVMTVPIAGGTPVVLATGQYSPIALAVDDASVYWGTSDGRVMKVAKSGGAPTTLAFYETSIQSLVVDATSVYWTTSNGDIMKTPVGGGTSIPILVGLVSIGSLSVDSTSVYFTLEDYPTGSVQKIPVGGGPPVTLWTGSDTPEDIQVDSTSVYFTTSSETLVKVSPK